MTKFKSEENQNENIYLLDDNDSDYKRLDNQDSNETDEEKKKKFYKAGLPPKDYNLNGELLKIIKGEATIRFMYYSSDQPEPKAIDISVSKPNLINKTILLTGESAKLFKKYVSSTNEQGKPQFPTSADRYNLAITIFNEQKFQNKYAFLITSLEQAQDIIATIKCRQLQSLVNKQCDREKFKLGQLETNKEMSYNESLFSEYKRSKTKMLDGYIKNNRFSPEFLKNQGAPLLDELIKQSKEYLLDVFKLRQHHYDASINPQNPDSKFIDKDDKIKSKLTIWNEKSKILDDIFPAPMNQPMRSQVSKQKNEPSMNR